MNAYPPQVYKSEVKQPCPEFELGSPNLFFLMITTTLLIFMDIFEYIWGMFKSIETEAVLIKIERNK